jgi:uncharacterized protein YidB (DUF937 family)
MGLMDVLNGMQNGPRGQTEPGKGGMSKMTMAILALLAYKAVKGMSGGPTGGQTAPSTPSAPAPTQPSSGGLGGLLSGGGLGSILAGGLGGLLSGGAAGSVLSGGLGDLLKQFQQNGLGDTADSWVGTGPNKQVNPDDLAKALGADQLDALTSQTGMSRNELLEGLSQYLPQVVDTMTPQGRVPDEHEISKLL